jgi:hypothetical protein
MENKLLVLHSTVVDNLFHNYVKVMYLFTYECVSKSFLDWTPGARTANDTAPCHWVQLYRYFVS